MSTMDSDKILQRAGHRLPPKVVCKAKNSKLLCTVKHSVAVDPARLHHLFANEYFG
jgi:hypothetical protein